MMKNTYCRLLMILCVLLLAGASFGMFQEKEPFYSWFYCFAWWSYILFIEAHLCHRGGESLLFDNPKRFFTLLLLSTPIWLIFEAFNFRLQNWHYLSVPQDAGFRWLGYVISFSTVLPAVFSTTRFLEYLGIFDHTRVVPLKNPPRLYAPFLLVGIVLLILPLLWPRFFFPTVWLGFIFLLEPVNHRWGAVSLIGDWAEGSPRKVYLLLTGGMICGLLWEFWNFWSGSKWFYTIPYLGFLKIFEMPILGFFGFPPFAVECYVMTNSLFLLAAKIAENYGPRQRRRIWIIIWGAAVLFDVGVLIGIDRFTVVSFAE